MAKLNKKELAMVHDKTNLSHDKINLIEKILTNRDFPAENDLLSIGGRPISVVENLFVDIEYGLALFHFHKKEAIYKLRAIYGMNTGLKHFVRHIPRRDPISFDNKGNLIGEVPVTKSKKFKNILSDSIARLPESIAFHQKTWGEYLILFDRYT